MHRRVRSFLHHGGERLALCVVQFWSAAGGFAVDQPWWTFGVEPNHPVADDLQGDTTEAGGIAARPAVVDRRQRQQPPGLPRVVAAPRFAAKLIGGEVTT